METRCASCDAHLGEGTCYCPACGRPVGEQTESSPGGASAGRTLAAGQHVVNGASASFMRQPLSSKVASVASLVLLVAFFLPWWSATVLLIGTVSLDGFNSWGWLSFIAWLAALALVVRLFAGATFRWAPRLDERMIGGFLAGAGIAEVIGNILFIVVAPTGVQAGAAASLGFGVVIALIAGLAIVYSGLLLLGPSWLPRPEAADRRTTA